MTVPDSVLLTRDAWHRLAEQVLSAARHAATGRIGLMPAPGGFATPAFGPEQTVLAVDLDELVLTRDGRQRRTRIVTVAQVAQFAELPLAGVTPGALAQVYPPATPLEPDAPLRIDRRAAQFLADWYQLGSRALAAFAAAVPGDEPTSAQLWPEHFDLGISAAGVNYGVSPGDGHIAEPYLYVGPHGGPPAADEFWNAPFGAVLRYHEVPSAEAAVDFFHLGRTRAQLHQAQTHQAQTHQRSTP